MGYTAHRHREPESRLTGYLDEARALLSALPPMPPGEPLEVSPDFETLRWFLLPDEVAAELEAGAR